jgi:microcystin-dependent protein
MSRAMNSAPVTPADFKVIIPNPNSNLCGNFVATLIKLPTLAWQLVNYMLDGNGNVSQAFTQQVRRPGEKIESFALLNDDNFALLADGREVSKADYAELYAAIGDNYGTASSTSNFKLPDMRACFPVGVGQFPSGKSVAMGEKIGEETTALTIENIPSHTHDVNGLYAVGLDRNSNNNGVTNNNGLSDAAAFTLTSEAAGGTGTPPQATGHNNLPPAMGVYVYIKV